MLDERIQGMLDTALELTPEDLNLLRGIGSRAAAKGTDESNTETGVPTGGVIYGEPPTMSEAESTKNLPNVGSDEVSPAASGQPGASTRGAYERSRTRASKTSTSCVGQVRAKHDWWPVDTALVGQIGAERFTAEVVENPSVKSGRSIVLTSGPAAGQLCLTPTRAALVATEEYRQSRGLGRSGGVTNGWNFWIPVNI